MEKKNKIILLIITFTLILIFSGITYAYFSSFTPSENGSTIYAKGGTMKISYANGSGNIVMENIYPKEEAWVNKVFTVTGNNTTELDMEYKLFLNTELVGNQFKSGSLTYSISGTSTNAGDMLVEKSNQIISGIGQLYLGTGVFKGKNATHSYNLKIFYKDNGENQNAEQENNYAGSVTIDQGSYLGYDSLLNFKLHTFSKDTPAFAGPIKRGEVESIKLINSINIPNNAIYSWDASEKQNGSVVAYTLDEDNNGLYELYIGQEGKVVLPSNSSSTFSYFSKLKKIDLSYIDTSKVTDMSGMFSNNISASEIIGLNNFDTSSLKYMDSMFANTTFTSIDLSSFDTSNVTNMGHLFRACKSTNINISNFDTSKVTDMSYMFYGNRATSIDTSNFNTAMVKNMSSMFEQSRVSSLNLSNFDTSNVTNMSDMFSECYATSLNLSSFNTSKVTNMSSMFYGSKAMELDLSSFDTTNVTKIGLMFQNSKATIGYARTQADADKFNSSARKPETLTFTVKN